MIVFKLKTFILIFIKSEEIMINFFKKIWEKIKQYRAVIIMYLMMLAVSIVSDIVFGGFNIIKYIAYAVLLTILVIIMLVYKDKIKQIIDDVENKVDDKLN